MKQPKAILRINPRTRKAYVLPPTLKPAPIFQVRGVSKKKYRRKRNLQPYTGTGQMMYSPVFANKPVQYVAVLIGHGSSRDSSSMSERIEYPLFKPKSDLIFVTPHGTVASTHGASQVVFNHLCDRTQQTQSTGEPYTGAQLMNALQSTIRSQQEPHVNGQLFKTTTLKQHDAGSSVSDLNIFRGGYTKNLFRIDGIYLFEVGKPCNQPDNHNVLTVNPTRLVQTHPDLWYVAKTATYLQSFIEPTETHGRVVGTRMVGTKKVLEYLFEPQYQIKGKADHPVHLSDVLAQPGIFPEHTAVIAYVCRCINTLQSKDQPYDSAVSADYTTATASSASSLSDAAAVSAVSAVSVDDAAFDDWVSSNDDAFSWNGSIGSDAGGSMKKRAKFKKTLKMRRS